MANGELYYETYVGGSLPIRLFVEDFKTVEASVLNLIQYWPHEAPPPDDLQDTLVRYVTAELREAAEIPEDEEIDPDLFLADTRIYLVVHPYASC